MKTILFKIVQLLMASTALCALSTQSGLAATPKSVSVKIRLAVFTYGEARGPLFVQAICTGYPTLDGRYEMNGGPQSIYFDWTYQRPLEANESCKFQATFPTAEVKIGDSPVYVGDNAHSKYVPMTSNLSVAFALTYPVPAPTTTVPAPTTTVPTPTTVATPTTVPGKPLAVNGAVPPAEWAKRYKPNCSASSNGYFETIEEINGSSWLCPGMFGWEERSRGVMPTQAVFDVLIAQGFHDQGCAAIAAFYSQNGGFTGDCNNPVHQRDSRTPASGSSASASASSSSASSSSGCKGSCEVTVSGYCNKNGCVKSYKRNAPGKAPKK
jgi:hypothetical protein